jgi:hypothetical protein
MNETNTSTEYKDGGYWKGEEDWIKLPMRTKIFRKLFCRHLDKEKNILILVDKDKARDLDAQVVSDQGVVYNDKYNMVLRVYRCLNCNTYHVTSGLESTWFQNKMREQEIKKAG